MMQHPRRPANYLDLDAFIAYLRLEGLTARWERAVVDKKVRMTLMVTVMGPEGLQAVDASPLAALSLYDHKFNSVSIKDMQDAVAMSLYNCPPLRVTTPAGEIDFLSLASGYCQRMQQQSVFCNFYQLLGDLAAACKPRRLAVSKTEDGLGPKATPITTITLTLTTDDQPPEVIGRVVCAGRGYSVLCSEARLVEGIMKTVTAEQARMIFARWNRL